MNAQALSAGQLHFVQEVASLLTPWGMAPSAARVYGYLLLHQAPVGLDQIAAHLQLSKVGAWKAARSLEDFGHVRRYGEPGSKRALYGPADHFETPLARQSELLAALGRVLHEGAQCAAGTQASMRLRDMARFYRSIRKALEASIAELKAVRRQRRRS